MSAQFEYSMPPERAWQRRVRLAVEVVDAVTGLPIREGIGVTVKETPTAPVVTASGRYVWLVEPGVAPTEVSIDPRRLPFVKQTRAVPPPTLPPPPRQPQASVLRVELAPTAAYPFEPGTSGVRSTFVEDDAVFPPLPLAEREVWLQWSDDTQPAPAWTDSPIRGSTSAAGDFAVIVRLASHQVARTDAQGRMQVRVAARHAGLQHYSSPLFISPARVADISPNLAWNHFTA